MEMNKNYRAPRDQEGDIYDQIHHLVEKQPRKWQSVAAATGLLGGLLCPILGTLLMAIGWLVVRQRAISVLHILSIVCFALTIPLLACGAHCLDLMEKKKIPNSASLDGPLPPETTPRGASSHREKQNPGRRFPGRLALLILVLALPASGSAQQTIFNVPTTNVLDPGKVYAELDVSLKPTDSASVNKFSSLVPRVVIGAGSRVEIGLNITGNVQPGADTTTLVPAIKWKPYQGKTNGIAIVVGDHLYFPVRNRAYDAGNYVYAEISKTFKSSTRVTVGGYDFTRNVVASANRAGGQFGFEQPLNKKVTLAADWFTGKHAAGYFTPGLVFKVGPKVTGYAGYSIGNSNASNGNHFFLLELGYNFN
jgi:hypothetical protein